MKFNMKYIMKHFSTLTSRSEKIRSNPFLDSLNIEFTHGYNKPFDFAFKFPQLININLLIFNISSRLPKDGYIVFIKLRHVGSNYKMCGNQVGFNYES